jgi:hypothetical protein
MPRSSFVLTFLLLASHFGSAQAASPKSDAAKVGLHGPVHGLHGPVHTVLTEEFEYVSDSNGKPAGSTVSTYYPQGYELEKFRYEADGTLRSHVTITRNYGVLKIETISVVPEENGTVIRSFDSRDEITQNEMYDQNGAKTSTTFELLPGVGNVTGSFRTRQESPTGQVTETTDTTDPATGVFRSITTVDGKTTAAATIQRDASGVRRQLSVQAEPDGSFTQTGSKPDGTTVQHNYFAPFKTHDYLIMNQEHRLIEEIWESPSGYQKTTFRHDEFGRQIEAAYYERSGKLVSKDTTEYRNDNYENWIEQKQSQWQAASGHKPAQSRLVSMYTRTITYY